MAKKKLSPEEDITKQTLKYLANINSSISALDKDSQTITDLANFTLRWLNQIPEDKKSEVSATLAIKANNVYKLIDKNKNFTKLIIKKISTDKNTIDLLANNIKKIIDSGKGSILPIIETLNTLENKEKSIIINKLFKHHDPYNYITHSFVYGGCHEDATRETVSHKNATELLNFITANKDILDEDIPEIILDGTLKYLHHNFISTKWIEKLRTLINNDKLINDKSLYLLTIGQDAVSNKYTKLIANEKTKQGALFRADAINYSDETEVLHYSKQIYDKAIKNISALTWFNGESYLDLEEKMQFNAKSSEYILNNIKFNFLADQTTELINKLQKGSEVIQDQKKYYYIAKIFKEVLIDGHSIVNEVEFALKMKHMSIDNISDDAKAVIRKVFIDHFNSFDKAMDSWSLDNYCKTLNQLKYLSKDAILALFSYPFEDNDDDVDKTINYLVNPECINPATKQIHILNRMAQQLITHEWPKYLQESKKYINILSKLTPDYNTRPEIKYNPQEFLSDIATNKLFILNMLNQSENMTINYSEYSLQKETLVHQLKNDGFVNYNHTVDRIDEYNLLSQVGVFFPDNQNIFNQETISQQTNKTPKIIDYNNVDFKILDRMHSNSILLSTKLIDYSYANNILDDFFDLLTLNELHILGDKIGVDNFKISPIKKENEVFACFEKAILSKNIPSKNTEPIKQKSCKI